MAEIAPKTDAPMECNTKLTYVDANGLALCCFGFGTWLFACLNLDIGDVTTKEGGFAMLPGALTWAVAVGLLISGIVQGFNGDKLGFTSYTFHACILGTFGYNVEQLFVAGNTGSMFLAGQFAFAAFWINIVFTIMAFKAAKMFGVLYASVATMFFVVGCNFCKVFGDPGTSGGDTGDDITGVFCLIVCVQCMYLLLPVLAGKGPLF